MNWRFRKDSELSTSEKGKLKVQTAKADAEYDNTLQVKRDAQAKIDKFNSGSVNSTYNPLADESIIKTQFIPSKRIPGTVTRFSDTKLDWDFKD